MKTSRKHSEMSNLHNDYNLRTLRPVIKHHSQYSNQKSQPTQSSDSCKYLDNQRYTLYFQGIIT